MCMHVYRCVHCASKHTCAMCNDGRVHQPHDWFGQVQWSTCVQPVSQPSRAWPLYFLYYLTFNGILPHTLIRISVCGIYQ